MKSDNSVWYRFSKLCGFFSRGVLPEYQWMNIPEVFLRKAGDQRFIAVDITAV
ncbi:MAG: hypothetical protein ABIG61_10700 [Planctomycetota bacterium]